MPAYGVVGPSGSGVAPLTAVEVRQGATISTARIYEIICGLASAPSDNYLTWVVQKLLQQEQQLRVLLNH